MIKWIATTTLLCLMANFGSGQETPTPPPATGWKRLQVLDHAWYAHMEKFWADQQAALAQAESEGGSMPAFAMAPPLGDFLGRYQEAAAEFQNRDEAVPFLMWIVSNTMSREEERKAFSTALETLMTTHVECPTLTELPDLIHYAEEAIGKAKATTYLKTLAAKNPNGDVKAHCTLARFGEIQETAALTSESYKNARREFMKAKGLAESTELKDEIQGLLDAREKLGIGQSAPDIVGIDLDGVPFKLSDSRGKVILLDFWGDW